MTTIGGQNQHVQLPKTDEFSREQIDEFKEAFELFDKNGGRLKLKVAEIKVDFRRPRNSPGTRHCDVGFCLQPKK
jgi:hypothetical protein